MPFDIELTDGIMHIRLHGTLIDADLLAVGEAMLTIERSEPISPPRITDMTAVEAMKIGFLEVNALAHRRSEAPVNRLVKSAIVAGSDVQYGMARMFQSLNRHPHITVEIFRDRAAALAWLRD